MELSSLPAGVHARRQLVKELSIKGAARKRWGQLFGIDAGEVSSQASPHHGSSKDGGVKTPEWEDWLDTGPCKRGLTVSPHIFKEEIAEGNLSDAIGPRPRNGLAHGLFILLVRAWTRDEHFDERQPDRCGLGLQKLLPYSVHCDSRRLAIDGRQKSHDLDSCLGAKRVKRPGTILATAPGQQGFGSLRRMACQKVCHEKER